MERVLHFDASEGVLRRRMLGRKVIEGRVDDEVDIHKTRVQGFVQDSAPIINLYEEEGLYEKVDCEAEFDEVYQKLKPMVEVSLRDCSVRLRCIDGISPSSVLAVQHHEWHELVEEGSYQCSWLV